MPSPNSVFTEMVTTTLRLHPKTITDNVSKNNALYRRLKARGNIRKEDGGYEIVEPIEYAENGTYQRYSGYDTLNIQASDVLSAAKYDWVQAAIHVTASGRELRMNSGREQIIKLVEARMTNATNTASNNMSIDLYSNGALANQIGGLALIIQNDGTGTVGGINSTTYPFWKNKFREISGTNTWTSTTIAQEMQALYMQLVRGSDKPDLIVSTHDFYSAFWNSLTAFQRYTDDGKTSANAGFQSLKFNQTDVIFDDNSNFSTTGEKMYFLNTDYLKLIVHRSADWTVEDEKISINQDAEVVPILWMGQLTCSNRSLQGVLVDAS